MEENSLPSDAVADFLDNRPYERRVVVFYDILGWRNHIEKAGKDLEKLGELRRLVLLHSRMLRLPTAVPVNVSTFSDNVVISLKPGKVVTSLLLAMAAMVLSTASRGFYVRGGIAVGDIVHDDEVVFGPGLNRAYEIESKIARFPRIVVDQEVIDECGPITGFSAYEDGIHFLDPFSADFVQFMLDARTDAVKPDIRNVGLSPPNDSLKGVNGAALLKAILGALRREIKSPLSDREWEKMAWLYDRVASRLGVPPARSYPRTMGTA
jgi:hypothetical protein